MLKTNILKKIRGAQLIMFSGVGLLIFNLTELDLTNFKSDKGPIAAIISNLLLNISMIISVRVMNNN
jgi:hypothetical protein